MSKEHHRVTPPHLIHLAEADLFFKEIYMNAAFELKNIRAFWVPNTQYASVYECQVQACGDVCGLSCT